jgi:hypothetical protein
MSIRSESVAKQLNQLKPGDKLSVPLSSFSEDPEISKNFFGSGQNYLFELKGPHKSVSLKPFSHFTEQEHALAGELEVEGVKDAYSEENGNHKVIVVKHTGVY